MANADEGLRIVSTLALVARELRHQTTVVIATGGITSAIVAREGLGARTAWVEGTLVPGVALWRLDGADGPAFVVFPGNVGQDDTLAAVVDTFRLT